MTGTQRNELIRDEMSDKIIDAAEELAVENGTEDFPDKNSPAFNKVFKCGDLLVSTAFLGAFKYFKRICGSVAVR